MKQEKNIRYWSRDKIEQIVKERNIDRKRFYEYSKNNYQKIIKRFYYAFCDYEKYPRISLDYCWLHFRENLKRIYEIHDCMGWTNMLQTIKDKFEYDWNKKLFLIVNDGWVYEGYIDEIIEVLSQIDSSIDDFYIVSAQFDRIAVYCDDGGCLGFYK